MNILRQAAIELRKQGYSYALIHEKLGVSKSSMSYWFKAMPYTPNQEVIDRTKNGTAVVGIRRHNERVTQIEQLMLEGQQEIGELTKRDLWLLGLGLYIGEGAKTTETLRISNSDPAIIRISIRWFKEICGLTDENFAIRLHLYPDNDALACQQYWQKVTGLREENFRRPSIDRRIDKRKSHAGKLQYGTAHLSVIALGDPEKGVRLSRKINGWISGALRHV